MFFVVGACRSYKFSKQLYIAGGVESGENEWRNIAENLE